MWQLQWGRGLVTAESGSTRSLRGVTRICFNGAAVLGPRRDSGTARPGTQRHPCFNGAAVLGPRRVALLEALIPDAGTLQWGRGLGTAESGIETAKWDLKWGRGLGTAESRSRLPDLLSALRDLQWGRGLGTAERAGDQSLTLRGSSFNGAAVLGPRRAHVEPAKGVTL